YVLTVGCACVYVRNQRRSSVVAEMAAIVCACIVLTWPTDARAAGVAGAGLIALACLGLALDNNLTRKIAGNDATLLAAIKGGAGGAAKLVLAESLVRQSPAAGP